VKKVTKLERLANEHFRGSLKKAFQFLFMFMPSGTLQFYYDELPQEKKEYIHKVWKKAIRKKWAAVAEMKFHGIERADLKYGAFPYKTQLRRLLILLAATIILPCLAYFIEARFHMTDLSNITYICTAVTGTMVAVDLAQILWSYMNYGRFVRLFTADPEVIHAAADLLSLDEKKKLLKKLASSKQINNKSKKKHTQESRDQSSRAPASEDPYGVLAYIMASVEAEKTQS
jgi:hypothetical protein